MPPHMNNGCVVSVKDGKTPLHLAVEKNDTVAVQMLLEAKPDINITSQVRDYAKHCIAAMITSFRN